MGALVGAYDSTTLLLLSIDSSGTESPKSEYVLARRLPWSNTTLVVGRYLDFFCASD